MTLDRTDILGHHRKARSKADTIIVSGYCVRNEFNRSILNVVLFSGDYRLKGYLKVSDILAVIEGKTAKSIIHKKFQSP